MCTYVYRKAIFAVEKKKLCPIELISELSFFLPLVIIRLAAIINFYILESGTSYLH